jgi:TRAP-type C4-dicarboxylate transport system permease large subunit
MRITLSALPALLVPLVMVGIYGGFVTVTEAAALSAVVALGVSLFFYRGLSLDANGVRRRERTVQCREHHVDHRNCARGGTLA